MLTVCNQLDTSLKPFDVSDELIRAKIISGEIGTNILRSDANRTLPQGISSHSRVYILMINPET